MVKALFLDRDGTINVDHGYVHEPEKFEFIEGIFELCHKYQSLGYLIIVITNQSGVARGYYTIDEMNACNAYMINEFAKRGITITDVFTCTAVDDSDPDRKPNPGLFFKARDKYDIDMASSVSYGDKSRDIEAAKAAGVGENYLIQS